MEISDWRKRIDEVDAKLVDLLSDRSGCVLEIGRIKRPPAACGEGSPAGRAHSWADRPEQPGTLANDAVARIFETIIHECIRLEEQLEEKQGLAGGCSPGSL